MRHRRKTHSSLPGPDNITREVLPNGITLLVRENFVNPSVVVSGYLPAGAEDEPREQAGLCSFVVDAMERGTQRRPFAQLYEEVESIGATFGLNAGTHITTFRAKGMAEHLPLLLDILADVIRTPAFEAQQVEKVRAEIRSFHRERAHDTRRMAALTFHELLYPPEHPYHRALSGYPETVERISRELRHALPNSVCTDDGSGCNNPGSIVYFIRTVDAGEYQTRSGSYASGQARAPLPVTPASASSFDVLSGDNLNAAAGQWVVVYNTDNSDIYSSGSRRQQISAISSKDTDGAAPDDVSVVQFASAVSFPTHSPARRFHVIENNAVLFYLQGTDLYRAQSSFSSPSTPVSGTENLLLENVSACTFTYVPGSLLRSGLLRIDITVDNGKETLKMIHEAQVYNAP